MRLLRTSPLEFLVLFRCAGVLPRQQPTSLTPLQFSAPAAHAATDQTSGAHQGALDAGTRNDPEDAVGQAAACACPGPREPISQMSTSVTTTANRACNRRFNTRSETSKSLSSFGIDYLARRCDLRRGGRAHECIRRKYRGRSAPISVRCNGLNRSTQAGRSSPWGGRRRRPRSPLSCSV